MKRMFIFPVLFLFLPVMLLAQTVVSIKINGGINPSSADFIHNSIEKANNENAECIIIHLNTPGGLLTSTREIVGDIFKSPVPVIVYVSPGGAHSGSAGVFITLAAHIAAMAPGTNIGAAHPVSLQGGPPDTIMNEKGTNDAAAFIRTIAEKRNRNKEWAEDAVRNSVSITEKEALEKKVIDLIADNEQQLLTQIDGKTIVVATGTKTLKTKNAKVNSLEMGFFEKILDMISDPNIAYILMMLGFYGLMFELYNPGSIFPGIVGVISLVLAFYSMNTMPVNYAGIALIIFGIVLFLLEIKIISHGLLTIGGIISILLGSMILFRTSSAENFVSLSWSVIIACTSVTALFFLFVVGMGIKAQRLKPVTGLQALIGETGESVNALDPFGLVKVHGEMWKAESVSGKINIGEKIIVKAINNLTLHVEQMHNNTS
jgi:membrane-bound serine protease (ClpP class)